VSKLLFYSILFVPIGLGVEIGRRRRRHSLPILMALLLAYDLLYVFFLYVTSGQWL
jgi:hypothetical protein